MTSRTGMMLLGVLLVGCRRPTPSSEEDLPLVPRVDDPAQVIARVNGVPILDADLRAQLRPGDDRRRALRALISQELLAQEAGRRGLARAVSVRDAQRRALAGTLIERLFRFGLQDIPQSLIEEAYRINRRLYQRPETVDVAHIVVVVSRRDTDELHVRALRLARKAHQIAVAGRLTESEFKEIATIIARDEPAISVKAEAFTTPLHGMVAQEFADAAFALSRPGQISSVVKTAFGYHVIYYKARTPARNVSLAAAAPEIRRRVFDEARARAFTKWIEEIERRYPITANPEMLARLPVGP
jgi:hypothetical protein